MMTFKEIFDKVYNDQYKIKYESLGIFINTDC